MTHAPPRARVPGAVAAAWREELEALDRESSRCSSRVADVAAPAASVPVEQESNDGGPAHAERRPDAAPSYTQYTAAWVAATQSRGRDTPEGAPAAEVAEEAHTGTWGEQRVPVPSAALSDVVRVPPVWPTADAVIEALKPAKALDEEEEGPHTRAAGVHQGSLSDNEEEERHVPGDSSCSDDDCSASDEDAPGEGPVSRGTPSVEGCDATAAALHRAAAECGVPSRSGAVTEVYGHHVAAAVAGLHTHRTDAALVASLADAMAAYAAAHSRCARQLRRAGAVHALGSALKVHASSAASPHAACSALSALYATCAGPACSQKAAQAMCSSGCIEATLTLVRGHVHGEPQVGLAACAALATWCRTSRRVAAHAAAAGAVACVLTTMRAHRTAMDVATAACAALASLTGGHCHAGKVASDALLAGAAAEVVAAMRDHDSSAELQRIACRCLRLLCTRAAHPGTAGAHIAQVGGLHACVVASGLYAADTALCTAALRACGALLRTGGAAIHAQAMSADVPAATVYVWRLHGATQRRCAAAACSVLVALLEAAPAAGNTDPSATLAFDAVISAGAPLLAVQALQRHGASHSPGLALSCSCLLALCTRKQPAGLQGEQVLTAVAGAMRRHTSHAGVAAAGAECVRNVAQALPPGATARAGAAEVVVAVMACHTSDAVIAVATAAAVAAVAAQGEPGGEGGTAARLVVAGAMHALAACMHAHCVDAHVTAAAAEACVAVLTGVLRAQGAHGTDAIHVAFTSGAGDAAIACLRAAGAEDAAVSTQAVTLLAVLFEAQSALARAADPPHALQSGSPGRAVALIPTADIHIDVGDSPLSMANALGAATEAVTAHGDNNTQLCTSYARLVDAIARRSRTGAGAALAVGCAEALVRCMDAHAGSAALAHSVTSAFASLAAGPGGGRMAKTGVRVCCDALRLHGSHRRDVATAAAAALAGLCEGHHPSCAVAASAGAPSALCVALRAHCSAPDAVAAAARCLAVLASHEACVRRCGDADALEALVTALALQPHNVEVARAVGAALAATAEAAGNAAGSAVVTALGGAGAPGAPSAPLQTGAVTEARPADPCMALSCACALLASHGTADPGVAVHGCRAIAALMPRAAAGKPAEPLPRGGVPGETAPELAAKAMPLLLLVLSAHATSPDARDAACRALAAVLVAPPPPTGAQKPETSVGSLVETHVPLGVRALDLGAMSLCLDALEDAPRDAGVQASGLELLCVLLDGAAGDSTTPSGAAAADAAVASAVADGAVELVVAAVVNHGGGGAGGAGGGGTAFMMSLAQAPGHAARVVAPALGVLARMAAMGHTHSTLVDAWAVRFLVQALSVHGPTSPEVATPGCVAIANLCTGAAAVRDEVAAAGAVTAVVEVLTACGTKHPGVAAAACDALRSLAADPDIELVAAYAGALEAVAAALALFGHVAAVQEAGLAAAACICWSHPDVAAHGREVGLPLLARAALDTRWKGHGKIRDAAQLVLTKLGEPATLSAADALTAMGEATGVRTVARAALTLAHSASATRQEVHTPEPPLEPDVLTWQEDSAIRAAVPYDEDEGGEEGEQNEAGVR